MSWWNMDERGGRSSADARLPASLMVPLPTWLSPGDGMDHRRRIADLSSGASREGLEVTRVRKLFSNLRMRVSCRRPCIRGTSEDRKQLN
jgi:hypothetical protein